MGVACATALSVASMMTFSILGGSSVGVARSIPPTTGRPQRFQYPRRIECGCGPLVPYRVESAPGELSVSSADRVWVWPYHRPLSDSIVPLSVSSADRVWVWRKKIFSPQLRLRLSVSSADRVWVWPGDTHGQNTSPPAVFQYPRRIECGCGHFTRRA